MGENGEQWGEMGRNGGKSNSSKFLIPQWVNQCLYKWKVMGSDPIGCNLQSPRLSHRHHGKIFVFVFFVFFVL